MMPTQALAAVPFLFVVAEEDRDLFNHLRDRLFAATDPSGALEGIAFHRLLTAAWNLHRVQKAELGLTEKTGGADPLAHPDTMTEATRFQDHARKLQSSYDRALKELSTLQTNRALRDVEAPPPPLADLLKIQRFVKQTQSAQLGVLKTEYTQLKAQAEEMVVESFSTKPPTSASVERLATPNTPVRNVRIGRNDPCPCGSGQKYKRCCGNPLAHSAHGSAA